MGCVCFAGGEDEVCEHASCCHVSVGDCHSSVLGHLPKDAATPKKSAGGREQVHQGKIINSLSFFSFFWSLCVCVCTYVVCVCVC